jgi:diguanylate cyclase (GGDEF)-like protein
MKSVNETGCCIDQETIFRRKDGSMVHISKNVQAIHNEDGCLASIVVFIRDMTKLHFLNQQLNESQEKLQSYINNLETVVDERTKELSEQLYTDSLTRLPNRLKLLVDLTKGLNGNTLILLNIDGFKEINSYFGQDAGDTILTQTGNELVAQTSRLKMGMVYKLPSDEFAIVIQENLTQEQVESIVVSIGETIKHRSMFARSDEDISLDVTIGVAMINETDISSRDLLSFADMAQKLAKKERKAYLFYTPSMQIKEEYEQNLGWIKRLKSAIEEDRIVPFFQPIVDSRTLCITKYEALVRIQEGDDFVSPGEFLKIAKK